jgi:hypothetical protein
MSNLINSGKVSMQSIIIHSSKQYVDANGTNSKWQNYPNLGIGARSSFVRNAITKRTSAYCETVSGNTVSGNIETGNTETGNTRDIFIPYSFGDILDQTFTVQGTRDFSINRSLAINNFSSNDRSLTYNSNIITTQNLAWLANTYVNSNVTNDMSNGYYDLSRVLLSTTITGNTYFISIDDNFNSVLTGNLVTYKDFYSKTFQLDLSSNASENGSYRIDSEFHPLYSLDYNSTSGNIVFKNIWGSARANVSAQAGYVNFSFVNNKIKAIDRYNYYSTDISSATNKYISGNVVLDTAFTMANTYVYYDTTSDALKLTSNISLANDFTVYTSPINVGLPSAYNPSNHEFVKNGRVPVEQWISNSRSDMEGTSGKVWKDMSSIYRQQITSVGYNTSTNSVAESMLDAIFSTGTSIRYAKEVYKTFRDGALKIQLKSAAIANGDVGQNTVPYVYFTNELSGTDYHPFMCIASYSISDKPNRLLDVPRPPGDGHAGSTGYADQQVTRDATLQLYLYKIPMRDYGEVTKATDNTLLNNIRDDAILKETGYTSGNVGAYNCYNYAGIAGIGVTIDGIVIYPIYNNVLNTAPYTAEITATGVHVGRGMGLHYHSDGHSVLNNNMNLYNMNDYVGRSHPPLIGFGLDGIALYGIYETAYSSMDGYGITLDKFGGHEHDGYGYHYHCHNVVSSMNEIDEYDESGNKIKTDYDVTNGVNDAPVSANISYTMHIMMKGAWKGNINGIPEFWDTNTNSPAYSLSQKHKFVGKP